MQATPLPLVILPKISLAESLIAPDVATIADLQQVAFEKVQQAAAQQLHYIELKVAFADFALRLEQPILTIMETVIEGVTLATKATGVKVNLIAELIVSDTDAEFKQQLLDIMQLRPKLAALACSAETISKHLTQLDFVLQHCHQANWPIWLQLEHTSSAQDLIARIKPNRVSCDGELLIHLLSESEPLTCHWLIESTPIEPQVLQQLQSQLKGCIAICSNQVALDTQDSYQQWLAQQALRMSYLADSEKRAFCYRLSDL